MSRRPTGWSPPSTGGRPATRVLRRVGGAVVAASVGALVTTLLVSGSGGVPLPAQDAGTQGRSPDRPSRALPRDPDPTGPLDDRLLPAAALPPSAAGRWVAVRTGPHEPRHLAGACHRFPMVSVGALRLAHRAYVLGDPATATVRAEHVVARFADPRTAWRAREVLLAWQAGCAQTLADRDRVRLSGLREVDGAQRYAVAWSPPHAARVREDVALVRVGPRLALVRVVAPAAGAGAGRRTVTAAVRAAGDLLR